MAPPGRLPFWLSTSSRVFTKILKPVLAYAHLHRAKIAHVPGQLVVKPRDIPGSSRANILAQVPVPKARVGHRPREIGSNPISGDHLSGDRAGHSCRPYQAISQENDQWLSIAEGFAVQQTPPAVQWLQVLGHLVSLSKLVLYGRSKGCSHIWQHVCSCLPEKSGGGGD